MCKQFYRVFLRFLKAITQKHWSYIRMLKTFDYELFVERSRQSFEDYMFIQPLVHIIAPDAHEIACYVGLELGRIKITRSVDGERYVQLHESVRVCNVYFVQHTSSHVNENFMKLLVMSDACRGVSTTTIPSMRSRTRQPTKRYNKYQKGEDHQSLRASSLPCLSAMVRFIAEFSYIFVDVVPKAAENFRALSITVEKGIGKSTGKLLVVDKVNYRVDAKCINDFMAVFGEELSAFELFARMSKRWSECTMGTYFHLVCSLEGHMESNFGALAIDLLDFSLWFTSNLDFWPVWDPGDVSAKAAKLILYFHCKEGKLMGASVNLFLRKELPSKGFDDEWRAVVAVELKTCPFTRVVVQGLMLHNWGSYASSLAPKVEPSTTLLLSTEEGLVQSSAEFSHSFQEQQIHTSVAKLLS